MSDSESLDYLQDGFDPWSLTVPRLRSVLVAHNVQYPATAKKGQLVELFTDNVVPQSKKILAARARAKRSSKGIVDASSQDTVSSLDQELMPPPSTARPRSPRKTPRIKSETPELGNDHLPAAKASPRKRQSRPTTAQGPSASDTDTGPDAEASATRTGRTPRRVTPLPSVKLEAPEEDEADFFKRTPGDDSVFSDDNPFQSGGSSPPAPARTPSNRRKTTGMEAPKTKSSSAVRRRTDGPDAGAGEVTHFSKSFEIPISTLNGSKTPEPVPTVEASEEFTPEEQLELAAEEATNPGRALAARRKLEAPARRLNLATPLWVLAVTLLGAYAAWYRQEKLAVGYCGLGRDATPILPSNIEIPEWAEPARILIEPKCEACPSHAYCYEDFSVRCEPDFLLKPHPLALGGLVPLPPTCEPDGEKVRRVKAVADKAVEELRERRAKFECGELVDGEGQKLDTPAIEEEELKETISAKRSKKMNNQEFDDLWSAAIGEIKARDEVEVEESGDAGDAGAHPTTLTSTSLARVPLSCALRRAFLLGLARYRLHLGGVVLAFVASLYARAQFLAHRATAAQIPALVDLVLERLATQKELAFEDTADDPFLFVPNLRDDVLRSVHSLPQRDRIWQRVRAVVEQNSNVRTGQREGASGDVGRAWEWIGPSSAGAIDTGRRRRSGRVSWGPDVKGVEDDEPRHEMVEAKGALHRKWEEPRPIY